MKKLIFITLSILLTGFVWGQTKTEVKISELPKSIPEYVSKNMNGFSIDKAFKVIDKGAQTYSVEIKNGLTKHHLSFDKDGKFLKKLDADNKEAVQKSGDQLKTSPPAVVKPSVPAIQTPSTTQPKKK